MKFFFAAEPGGAYMLCRGSASGDSGSAGAAFTGGEFAGFVFAGCEFGAGFDGVVPDGFAIGSGEGGGASCAKTIGANATLRQRLIASPIEPNRIHLFRRDVFLVLCQDLLSKN